MSQVNVMYQLGKICYRPVERISQWGRCNERQLTRWWKGDTKMKSENRLSKKGKAFRKKLHYQTDKKRKASRKKRKPEFSIKGTKGASQRKKATPRLKRIDAEKGIGNRPPKGVKSGGKTVLVREKKVDPPRISYGTRKAKLCRT